MPSFTELQEQYNELSENLKEQLEKTEEMVKVSEAMAETFKTIPEKVSSSILLRVAGNPEAWINPYEIMSASATTEGGSTIVSMTGGCEITLSCKIGEFMKLLKAWEEANNNDNT